MNKYIDAEKLIAEIQKRVKFHDDAVKACTGLNNIALTHSAGWKEDTELIALINSLQQEQPEVDLEKELDRWRHEHFHSERDGHYSGEYLERESQLDLARRFYGNGREDVKNSLLKWLEEGLKYAGNTLCNRLGAIQQVIDKVKEL